MFEGARGYGVDALCDEAELGTPVGKALAAASTVSIDQDLRELSRGHVEPIMRLACNLKPSEDGQGGPARLEGVAQGLERPYALDVVRPIGTQGGCIEGAPRGHLP